MRSFPWPGDGGWPYSDSDGEVADAAEDLGAGLDDDLMSVQALSGHLFDGLDPLERQVLSARFGLAGSPIKSMKELHHELGVPRSDLRTALGSGLAKVRSHLV